MVVGAKGVPLWHPFLAAFPGFAVTFGLRHPPGSPLPGLSCNWFKLDSNLSWLKSHFISEASLGGGTWEFPGVRFRHSPCSVCI